MPGIKGLDIDPSNWDFQGDYDLIVNRKNGSQWSLLRNGQLFKANDSSNQSFVPSGTGATTRTVQAKLREIVSVKDFGAVGDGVTDDTTAISTAITAAAGKALYFPSGTYLISSALTVTASSTRLFGDGPTRSVIQNTSLTGHCIKFYPNDTTATTVFINNCAIDNISIYSAANKTAGAGVYALQCNGFRLHNVQIQNHPEGLLVSGGQLNIFDKLTVFASAAILTGTPVSSSQALRFCEAPIDGGSYQDCLTCELSNVFVGTNRCLDKGIVIESADSLHFTNCYINGAYTDEVYVKILTASRYVSGVKFDNVFLDGVSMTTAPTNRNGINMPSSANGTVHSVNFNNCQIANYTGKGCVIGEGVGRVSFTGGTGFVNIDNWAVDVVGDNTFTELTVTGCNFKDVGEVTTSKGGVSANTVLNVIIAGNTFTGIGNTSATAISTSGTNANGNIDNNVFSGCTANVTDTATWTGKISGIPQAFTPSVTFATPGDLSVSYTTRIGRSIRKGSLCTVELAITTSSFTHSTASGNFQVTGLPVAATTATIVAIGAATCGGVAKAGYGSFMLRKDSTNTLCTVEAGGTGVAPSTMTTAEVASGGTVIVHGTITYECLP